MTDTLENCVLTAADGCGRDSCTPPPTALRILSNAVLSALISLQFKPKSIMGICSIVGFRLFKNNHERVIR